MGKIACVTGGTKGVGREIAAALMQAGHRVLPVARTAPEGACSADMSVPGAFAQGLHAAGIDPAEIGILVCAAGLSLPHAPVHAYTAADYRSCFDLNVFGVLQAITTVLPGMMARRAGRIVAIGGTYGHRGVAGSSIYAASKWALRGLIKSVAMEAGPFGITANIVAPGGIDGEKLRAQFVQSAAREGLTAEAVHDRFAARAAMQKLVTADDVAAMVLYLVGDAGRHITGQDFLVDAGTIV